MTFSASDISPRIGTRIETDAATLVSGKHATEIRQLLEQRGALVFPGLHLTDADQIAFSRTLAPLTDVGEEGIFKVTLDPKVSATAEYLKGTFHWHVDGFSDDVPALGSVLSARVLSKEGGQTEFANTYAAYDDLPESRKRELEKLRIAHTLEATQRDVFPNPPEQLKAAWARMPTKVHPLVWTHRSGRKSLMLGSSADWVEGMDKAASRALIDELMAWSTQPKFVYRHEWTLGDTVIWDNTGVMHRVVPYAADSGRMMHRTTLQGEEAIA